MIRASDYPREYDGTCLQMRLSYSPAAHLFLFLVQWTDCYLAGALGLLRILIYKVICKMLCNNFLMFLLKFAMITWQRALICDVYLQAYADGKTTMSIHERKASIREFYGV